MRVVSCSQTNRFVSGEIDVDLRIAIDTRELERSPRYSITQTLDDTMRSACKHIAETERVRKSRTQEFARR
jgi:hypothetical protein